MRAVKAVVDRVLAAVALVALAPLFLAITLWIWLDDGRPALIAQERAGRDGVPFRMLKFRTMVRDAIAAGRRLGLEDPWGLVRDDPRVTRSGSFLRRTSLDELPQLLNVLRGDMSLVGPRPPIPSEVALYEEHHFARFHMRPGITGPWQVSGRSNIPFQDMIKFDYQYVAGWSLARDIEILLSTLPAVISGRGAY